MEIFFESLFVFSAGLVIYTYAGYPLLIAIAARWFPREYKALPLDSDFDLPFVSVLIAAYNAEQHIEARIQNVLDSDYPLDKLEIVIASDGSTDQTARIVRMMGLPNVRVLEYRKRRGKTAALVSSVAMLNGEVIVFSDASTQFKPTALRRLALHFVDPHVGVVSGKVTMLDDKGRSSEGLYWKLETKVKACESRFDSLIGASGAIYAVRRDCFIPPRTPQINDDLVLPMLARLRSGCRMILDRTAEASVIMPPGLRNEFRRRRRIGIGAFQSIREIGGLLNPRNGRLAFSYFSHKLLRWTCPFWLGVAFIANLFILDLLLFRMTMAIQVAFYTTAMVGLAVTGKSIPLRLVRLCTSFCVMNLALMAGFIGWVRNANKTTWEPTLRPATTVQPYGLRSVGSRARNRSRRIG